MGGTVLAPTPPSARSLWADGLDFQPESGVEKDVAPQMEPAVPGPRCENRCWASAVLPQPQSRRCQAEPHARPTGTWADSSTAPVPKGARASRGRHVGRAHAA